MPRGFYWKLGNYIGGDVAVHPSYKPYLAIETPDPNFQRTGQIIIQPRDTSQIVVSGLGFQPDIIIFACYRARNSNFANDTSFGHRGGGMTFGVANADVQFTGSTRIKQGWDISPGAGVTSWREDCCVNVISVVHEVYPSVMLELLTLELDSIDADGFTLNTLLNLYDQTEPVSWLAMKGNFRVGIMDAGTTSIRGFSGTPTGAMFLSVKNLALDGPLPAWDNGTTYLAGDQVEHQGLTYTATGTSTGSEPPSANWVRFAPDIEQRLGYWDHMQGFAGQSGQATIWGGARPTSWDWSTERWEDDAAILFCTAANNSAFVGTSVDVKGIVSDWVSGGIDLSWPIFNNEPYRIGYVLADPAEFGIIETTWYTRPEAIGGDGANFVPTTILPRAILMLGTNYTFDWSDPDPLALPRSPGMFNYGGSGGLGWHASPYSENGDDAFGVHTYGNAVAEMGHYANSGTQHLSRYIMAGNGTNVNPPAAHQHTINVVAPQRIVGMNWRYAERHITATRALRGES
jgi:hypothetical protein